VCLTPSRACRRFTSLTLPSLAASEFGNIFAELLPGNFCKLQTLEGKEITQGLEVKVRLGTVWKSSLTELSGGQRSLIALSLIMSLLRFKPCVMPASISHTRCPADDTSPAAHRCTSSTKSTPRSTCRTVGLSPVPQFFFPVD